MGETTAATMDWYEPAEPTDREQEQPISCRCATHTGISHLSLLSTSLQGRPQRQATEMKFISLALNNEIFI